ncbi:CehA/McbA family metallohydrolase [Pontibacter sp. MBLB2868]|uniref:CehA/McbA family metallohydrolase n=1 Tax=Pontibacter sp. MBLB2868 TaxID=3451555 RepID=UPI003F74D0E9
MMKLYPVTKFFILLLACSILTIVSANAQVIISQYYEGTGVNKWIELTNLSSSEVNTASPQLKLASWQISGDAGNMNLTDTPSNVVALNVVIPAHGTVLIGRSNNSTEVPYLTVASAAQLSDAVINFNGNDAIALLDASENVIDAFGHGINAKDKSYVRNASVLNANPTFTLAEWSSVAITTVQDADGLDDSNRLGVHSAANLPACVAPANQPTAMTFGATGTKSITGSFTGAAGADEYLVVMSTTNSLSANPQNGVVYAPGDNIGGGVVVGKSPSTSFTASGLTPSTSYYFFVYALTSSACNGGPLYLVPNPLGGSHTTATPPACASPAGQATNFGITYFTSSKIQGKFDAFTGVDEYLVVMSTTANLTSLPVNGTSYQAGASIGNGKVVQQGAATSFTQSNLDPGTTYYFYVFSVSTNCTGGPIYLTASALTGSKQTREQNTGGYNFYYGNMHAHSSYSDGNKDDATKTPIDNYAYAKEAMHMDFLGISEHNHTGAGMQLANWKPGRDAAKAATTDSFVALYGMEWGTISGGGHVIVYGLDSLVNWETGQYQIYVPKSTYSGTTGLFNRVNKHGGNAIAYLAHPNTSDYNNLAANYDGLCDKAIVGTAVESGPAFSTITNYTNPGSSMSYLSYYNKMLSKGYFLGPTIDHDNHNFTFGRTARSRLVVLAPELTEDYLLEAMKSMRFYATQDFEAKVYFTINSQPMGSVFTDRYAPNIAVTTETASPVSSIKLMHGVPGSGVNATQIALSNGPSLTYTDNALANLATGYYYLDITEDDGSRTVTSPIWYTRNDNTVLGVDEELSKTARLSVWPNPTQGNINVSFDLLKRENVWVRVLGLTGKVVSEELLSGASGHIEKQLNLASASQGLYILQVQIGSKTISKKIVVQ